MTEQPPPPGDFPPPQGPRVDLPPPQPQPGPPTTQPLAQPLAQPPTQSAAPPAGGPPGRSEQTSRWALGFAAVGTVTMVVSLFLHWFDVNFWITYVDAEGDLDDERKLATPFNAVSVVKDVAEPDPDGASPGVFSQIFYPWLLIVLVVVCCALAVASAIGMRRRNRTIAVRWATIGLLLVTAGLVYWSCFDLGVTNTVTHTDLETSGEVPGVGDAEVQSIRGYVDPYPGIAVPGVAGLLLAIAAMIGPKVHKPMPVAFPGQMAPGQIAPGQIAPGQIAPGQGSAPLGTGSPGVSPQGPPYAAVTVAPLSGTWSPTTQVPGIVATGAAAVLCLVGYLVLPWSKDVDFADISEAARDYGSGDQPVSEAYFGWLGWVFLVLVLLTAGLVALGRKPMGVRPQLLRPILTGVMVVALLVHLWVLIDSENTDFAIGAFVVPLGLALAAVGSAWPLRPPTLPWARQAWTGTAPPGPPPPGTAPPGTAPPGPQ